MTKYLWRLITCLVLINIFCFTTAWAGDRHYDEYREGREDEYEEYREDHYNEHEERDHDRRGEHHEEHEEREYLDRSFYESRRISDAMAGEIVLKSFPDWKVGDGWKKKNKHGGLEIIIPWKYKNQIIGEVKINPVTGEIMPEKVKPRGKELNFSVAQAREIVKKSMSKMIIGDKIRLGKHGNFWDVPLLFQGIEVEEIKVGTGTGRILPDWHIEEEAYHYLQR